MSAVPGYPAPAIAGHGSKILIARVKIKDSDHDVLIATGRVHLYEGHSPFDVSLPIHIASDLGITNVILTNAAGGLSEQAKPGSLVVISDHINLTGQNAAATPMRAGATRFIDMVNAYDKTWREAVCGEHQLQSGVYAGVFGPTFETPAEARMLSRLGADLAGMSTVQEVIAARGNGQKVFACSFVTNQAGGSDVAHSDVLKSVQSNMKRIQDCLEAAIYNAPTA